MLRFQATLLAFVSTICIVSVSSSEVSVGDYLRQHTEIILRASDEIQTTEWDQTLVPIRDLLSPVRNQPGRTNQGRPRTRERRQTTPIQSDSCYLFFANRRHLIKVQNVPTFRYEVVRTGFRNAIAVDFDKRDGYLFWSDVVLQGIYRSRVDGSELTQLVNTNITTPDGIAWDWVNKKLYWTDAGDKDLEVYDPATRHRKTLIQNGPLSFPRAIVVDPRTKYMYWTDWGTPATIERASMDGSNRRVLHNTNLRWPNALTMDYENQVLYWLDAGLDLLESSNADGSGRSVLLRMINLHPFSLTFYDGSLFWSDWLLDAVIGAHTSNVSAVNIVIGDLSLDPMGITAACASRQPISAPDPCDGRCQGKLCLLSKSNPRGYKCVCPDSCKPISPFIPGPDLPEPRCEPSCGQHGLCTGRNYCTCREGWRGDACEKGVCTKCVHGECIGPDICACDDDWTGANCDQAVCCPECYRGTCSSPKQCTCERGWGGDTCEQQTCIVEGGCENGGTCEYDRCVCQKHYTGDRCEKYCNIIFQNCR